MIPLPSDETIRFKRLETLYERRIFLRELSKLYNIDTDIDKEIVKCIELTDQYILLTLKLIANRD